MKLTSSKLKSIILEVLTEEIYGKKAILYHGSRAAPEAFLSQIANFRPGLSKGAFYGAGLYTVYELDGTPTLRGDYGAYIYKIRQNLDNFLCFTSDACEKIYGKNISPYEQLVSNGEKHLADRMKNAIETDIRALLGEDGEPPYGGDQRGKYIYKVEFLERFTEPPSSKYSSGYSIRINKQYYAGQVPGIIYKGAGDGNVVLIYDVVNTTVFAWAQQQNAGKLYEPKTPIEDLEWNEIDKNQLSIKAPVVPNRNAYLNKKSLTRIPEDKIEIIQRAFYDKILRREYDINSIKRAFGEPSLNMFQYILNRDAPVHFYEFLIDNELVHPVELGRLAYKTRQPKVIHRMAISALEDEDFGMLTNALQNKNIDPETSDYIIRNIEYPIPKLRERAKGAFEGYGEELEKHLFLIRVLSYPSFKSETLEFLLNMDTPIHEDEMYNRSAIKNIVNNSSLSSEIIEKYLDSEDSGLREAAVTNKNLSPDVMREIAAGDDSFLRLNLAKSMNAPEDILTKLAEDENEEVKEQALKTIAGIKRRKERMERRRKKALKNT